MTMIDQRFPDKKEVGIATFGDIHYGSSTCNVLAVQKWLKKIEENKWYVILMGDLIENATIGSVGAVFEQVLSPQEQVRGMVRLLEPIKDYIIGGVSGNHEQRSARTNGLDINEIISFDLGVTHFGYSGVGRIQVGDAHWYIVAHHGAGGGILQGSKLNMIRKLANIYPMADLYLAGHAHADVSGSDRVFRIVNHCGKVSTQTHTRHYSGTGSLLDYSGSYAEAKLYPPASLSQVVHYLGDRRHASREGGHIKPYRREVFHF